MDSAARIATQRGRVEAALGASDVRLWAAPGRVNLIGEHLDYNGGPVLPLAVGRYVVTGAVRRPGTGLRVRSLQRLETVDLPAEAVCPGGATGWAAYVAGVVWALGLAGVGLEVVVDGDVPVGAGLSSSAALECAAGAAVADLLGVLPDRVALALAAQRGENEVVGVPCGLMDQMASTCCRAGHVLLFDTASLMQRQVSFDPEAAGMRLLVVDTRTPHQLAEGAYAERRLTCEQVATRLGLRALADLPPEQLEDALSRVGPAAGRRVRHVVAETARVRETVRLLDAGRLGEIGPLLTASHRSLRDDFEVSCRELDLAVDAALAAGALGARMTGGGFGGSAVALCHADRVPAVERAVRVAASRAGVAEPVVLTVRSADGVHRLA